MNAVTFIKVSLPNGWLGNMAPYPVDYAGVTWRTTEHLFQALRFHDPSVVAAIQACVSPMAAKFTAKKHADKRVVEPRSETDLRNMRMCLRLKLEHHPELADKLRATGDATIIEDVTNRRNRPGNHQFWGAALIDGEWVGTNMLGRLWMELRDELGGRT